MAKGLVYIGIGITWLSMPSRGRVLGISWFPGLTDWVVGALWLLGGGAAVATGLWGRHRRWGFAGLQAVAFFLSLVFLVSAIIGVIPDDVLPGGNTRSIVTTISYFVCRLLLEEKKRKGTSLVGIHNGSYAVMPI